jgi:hypothetical protein
MRQCLLRLASVAALAIVAAILAAAASANGGGHDGWNGGGNGNGNGHDQQAAPQQQQQSAPAQQPQPAPQEQQSQPGVKPSNDTQHWTKTNVGHSPDVSKRYGNGQTAAQIAKSRGAGPDVQLVGPGNSQPHKVVPCGKSHGVDVHAVKSYGAQCGGTEQPVQQVQASKPAQAKKPCKTKQQTATVQAAGVKPSSTTSHWTKTTVGASPDVSKRYGNGHTAAQIAKSRGAGPDVTLVGPGNSQPHKVVPCDKEHAVDVHAVKSYDTTCTSVIQQAAAPAPAAPAPATPAPEAPAPATPAPAAPAPATPAPEAPATPAPQPAAAPVAAATPTGGVLGAQATLATPKAKTAPTSGVLGAAANVAGASLPFTGFPLWIAVLVAIVLVAGGLVLRRRADA